MTQPTTADSLRAKSPLPAVDPNINVPKGVRDAGARAEAIQQALVGASEPSILPTTHPPDNAPDQTTVSPQDPPSQLTPPAEGPPPEPEHVPPEQWELRFKAMKGRYDGLRSDVAQMSEHLQRLQNENAILRSSAPPPTSPEIAPLLTEQEVQDYGPEFIDVVRRAATEVAAPLHAEIQSLRGQLGTVQQETSNAFLTRMNATIGGLVPQWQQINQDPQFVQWVQLPETYSGVIRQRLMQDAWNNGDAHRVAAFFRAFLAEAAAVDPQRWGHAPSTPSPTVPALSPGGQVTVPLATRLSLESLAAPGRAQSSAQLPADKPVYTAQDISRFYTECAAGKWRTRERERAAIDADIIAAQHEGRIIPDQRTVRPTERNGHW